MQKMITKSAMLSTINVSNKDMQLRSNVIVTASNIEEDGIVIGFNYNGETVHQLIFTEYQFNDLMNAIHEIAAERGLVQ